MAGELKREGYKIIAYGARPLRKYREFIPTGYVMNPTLKAINMLYSQASVMIKATKMDARSLSPLEAMTKGCAVSRAINQGDDVAERIDGSADGECEGSDSRAGDRKHEYACEYVYGPGE